MANVTIRDLPVGTDPADVDEFVYNDDGVDRRISKDSLRNSLEVWISKYTTDQLSTATSLREGNLVRTPGYYSGWAATASGIPVGGNDGVVEERDGSAEDGGSIIFITGTTLQVRMTFPSGVWLEQFGVIGGAVNNKERIEAALAYSLNVSFASVIQASNVTLPAGSSIKGVDQAEISLFDKTQNLFNAAGKFHISGFIVDMTGTTGADTFGTASISSSGDISGSSVKECLFIGQAKRPYIALSPTSKFDTLDVTGNKFIGPYEPDEIKSSFDGGALRILADSLDNRNIRIHDNEFSRIASNAIQLRYAGGPLLTKGCFKNLSIKGNKFFDPGYSSTIGNTWIETISVDDYVCSGNTFLGGGRAMSCGSVRSGAFTGNVMKDLYKYGVEQSTSDGVTYSGNTLYNCHSFISDNGDTGIGEQSKNISVIGNTIIGGNLGLSGWNFPETSSCIVTNSNSEGYKDWDISDNKFADFESGDVVILVSGSSNTSGFKIKGNTYTQRTELAYPSFVKLRHGSNHEVKENKINRYSDISDATGGGVFSFIGYQVGAGCDDIEISENRVAFTGSDTRAAPQNVDGISHNSAAGALTNLVVNRNELSGNIDRPLNIVVDSGDTVVLDNDTRKCSGTDSINSAVIYRRVKRVSELPALPTTGVWERGDKVYSTFPSPSGQIGWVCTTSGDFSGTPPVFKAFGTIQA